MGLINDILDFSRIESGELRLESSAFSPRLVAEESVEVYTELAMTKHLEIACIIEPDIPSLVVGDGQRVRQIITNLVSNAVKFTESGSVVMRMSATYPDTNITELQISVTDTGIGMSEECIQKLFQYFTQADASTTRRFGGTGLGLAICQRLINLMNGNIRVSSRPGEGSQFEVTLRLQRVAEQPLELGPLFGCRVLLVGNKPITVDSICSQLQFFGLMVTIYHNGKH